MRAHVSVATVAKETGALLKTYLRERGVTLDPNADVTISYGIPSHGVALNGNCGGGDKIRRLRQMQSGGVRNVPWFAGDTVPQDFTFPGLARKLSGHGGEDLVPVFQKEEIPWRLHAGWAWFSSYVPVKTEYRVWMFRDECLDVYEKVMTRPEDYAYIGRNFRNGFDFKRCETWPADPLRQADRAIRALSFDFGAVDVLLGQDGLAYVLEVNTAPGVIKSGAQHTLATLANRMVSWLNDGCPERGY